MSKTRLEAFTDAVIAIVMTLLVLELDAPEEASFAALWAMRYSFLIYMLSFLSLAVYWVNHHHLFQVAKKVSGGVLWYNLLFILFLTLYPFSTAWVDKNLAQRVPELTYGVVALATNLSYFLLARKLAKVNGPDSQVAQALKGYRKSKITLALNVTGLLVGLWVPYVVIILFVLSMLLWVVPERRIEALFLENRKM